jgi:hypothetical protein
MVNPMHHLLFLLLPLGLLGMAASSSSSDVWVLLHKVKPALQGASITPNAQLGTWNASTPLCLWRGLRWSTPDGRPLHCDDDSAANNLSSLLLVVSSIRLPASALSGRLPPELGAFPALESLYLGANSLSGPIPLELGNAPVLSVLDLSGNALSGALPVSIWNLCDRVTELRLHGNALTGAIPAPAGPNTTCDRLRVLDLGGNHLTGGFPSFVAGFRGLQRLDLSYNNFSGQVPPALAHFAADSFVGNSPELCGPPLVRQCVSGRSSRAVAGLAIGLMAGAVVAASLCIGVGVHGWRRNRADSSNTEEQVEEEGRLVVFQGGEHLTAEDVLNATGQVVAKTSYCTVYKAKLAGGSIIELRLLREDLKLVVDEKEKQKLKLAVGRARHENLVALRAVYQGRRGEKLLVYDYFPKSSTLHDLLHGHTKKENKNELTWPRRHKIALGVARALAYLHAGHLGEAHGNVRSSNVLVDDDLFVPRLTEYALHRLLLLTPPLKAMDDGYKAPELLRSMNKCSARTDVYAFGILLLELLVGRNPGAHDLPSLVKAAVMEEAPLKDLLDADLLKHAQSEEGLLLLLHALKLAMGCCAPTPAARPTMAEVVSQLEDSRPRNHTPADSRSGGATPA